MADTHKLLRCLAASSMVILAACSPSMLPPRAALEQEITISPVEQGPGAPTADPVVVWSGTADIEGDPVAPRITPGSAAGWFLDIPVINVAAEVAVFGLTPDGVMDVPRDHTTVAWYDFTAVPGREGNAVLAAHVDWAGFAGVFSDLAALAVGDTIDIRSHTGADFAYRVDSIELVDPASANVDHIVGQRTGASTLTLITCGGEFNRITREYEARVIVRASLAQDGTVS